MRHWRMSIALAAGCWLGGCSYPLPGTTRALGTVSYEQAFASAREVMGQYFSIASADPETGVIAGRPMPVEAPAERLLGGTSPARQLAEMRLRRDREQVVAHLSVAVQRQGAEVYREAARLSAQHDVPNLTPAERDAALTPEQTQAWETRRYDHALEARILNEIYRSLHPAQK